MADYAGLLMFDPRTDVFIATLPISHSLVNTRDASLYAAASGGPYATPLTVHPLDMPSVVADLLLHNWRNGCSVESSFNVDVVSTITDAEERRLLSHRPTRSIQVRWTALSRAKAQRAMMGLLRHGVSRMPIPLYSDYTVVDSGGAAARVVSCETAYRRFFAGQRVALFDLVAGEPANVEYALIDNVQVTHLVLSVALSNTYASGAIVLPLIDAEVSVRDGGNFITSEVAEIRFTAKEVPGPSALLPTASGTPDGYLEYLGDPIFAPVPYLPNAGYGIGFARAGKLTKMGRGQTSDTYGDRPKYTHKVQYRRFSRANIWPIIQFFDSRRGRLRRFWFVPPEDIWNMHSADTTYVSIAAEGNVEDILDFHTHITVVLKDGSIYLREIASVVDNSSTWRLNFDEAIAGLTAADIERVAPAHLVRNKTDAMKERWYTDQTCDISLEFIEVLDEDSVNLICLT